MKKLLSLLMLLLLPPVMATTMSPVSSMFYVIVLSFLLFLSIFILGIFPVIIIRIILKDSLEGRKWFNFIYVSIAISIVLGMLFYLLKVVSWDADFKSDLLRIFLYSAIINIIAYFIYRKIVLKNGRKARK